MWCVVMLLFGGCTGRPGTAEGGVGVREETFVCAGDGDSIGASFFWPSAGTASLTTAVVAVGAQRWNRYGDLPGQPWGHYRDIALAVAGRGAAVVLFDKGGTGVTGGPPATFDARVREVLQVLSCVRTRPEVGSIVLVGHSQGAAVVAAAAVRNPPLRLVLLAPSAGVSTDVGIPVTVIQPATEATPALRPILVGGVNHLFLPEPATAGTSHVSAEALEQIGDAVLGVSR